jgi:cell division protein FtsZ
MEIRGARGVLFNVVGGRDLGIQEINEAAQVVQEVVADDAEIIFGAAIDDSLGDEVKVTVIATGFQPRARIETQTYADELEDEEPETLDEPAHQPQPEAAGRTAPFGNMPEVDVELPAFLRRGVNTRY